MCFNELETEFFGLARQVARPMRLGVGGVLAQIQGHELLLILEPVVRMQASLRAMAVTALVPPFARLQAAVELAEDDLDAERGEAVPKTLRQRAHLLGVRRAFPTVMRILGMGRGV